MSAKRRREKASGPGFGRREVGFVLCGILAVVGALSLFDTGKTVQAGYTDFASAQADRFDALNAALPENAQLGFVTELATGSDTETAMFDVARYFVAPRMLKHSAEENLVLGDFAQTPDLAAFGAARHLRVEKDFGQGIVLFRREGR